MVTFEVEDVTPVDDRFRAFLSGKEQAVNLSKTVEAFSHVDARFLSTRGIPTKNAFLAAVHAAYDDHLDLCLSPDIIWTTIMQGISAHVDTDPERFRNVFVSHCGQKELIVRDDSLRKGSWNNGWKAVIESFSQQIALHLDGDIPKTSLQVTFTTTKDIEKVAHIMTFMHCVKHYFRYTVMTMCGIANIELLGTKEDWVKLSLSLDILDALGLSAWKAQLRAILAHFVAAFDGNVNKVFWADIYREAGGMGSGSVTKVSGWISKLFLYTAKGLNLGAMQEKKVDLDPADFPSGITNTPFKWIYFGEACAMNFSAGVVGITVPTQYKLKPELGWFVS